MTTPFRCKFGQLHNTVDAPGYECVHCENDRLRAALTEAQHNEARAVSVVMAQEGIIERLRTAFLTLRKAISQNGVHSPEANGCWVCQSLAIPVGGVDSASGIEKTSSVMMEQEKEITRLRDKITELEAETARLRAALECLRLGRETAEAAAIALYGPDWRAEVIAAALAEGKAAT